MPEAPLSVLLVEDEPLLADVCADALRLHGHRVTACADAERALAVLAGAPAGFDVLLTDLLLPGIDGLALAERATALRPGLPVVLATGHVTPAVAEHAAQLDIAAVLPKPYTPAELLVAVERAARRGAAAAQ